MSYFGGKEKLTGLEGLKLDGPKIRLKKGALKEEDLQAAEAEGEGAEGADMEVDQGAGADATARARGDFIPTETHMSRVGYVFKMGAFGLGLYRYSCGPSRIVGYPFMLYCNISWCFVQRHASSSSCSSSRRTCARASDANERGWYGLP